ncbi:MAG: hypothetical protein KO318_01045 [Methanobacterium sp.]|jgi:hypothetical protein|uniref:Uncharacterized protein n=1 Tax=Methanobacterium subterraneum TaxID=59277 RepID=A0A2H4VNA5_9EURY|nr:MULTISPECIES: hypothetical protein [Methanobacterium]AUB58579.1 hypothetical protein BK008_09810 [Methanobacterium sp. MZ-A1]AUB59581.1 hypothetical protein BK009_02135 [Methanobacterium subterraneum]MBW4257260.1 hypothetical protein [Methanobacterium sp. YSL]MCC7559005.1 hypothetical protein [Methanobacterium sp.]
MASMCTNPDCGNVRRVEGVCPECGSPAKDLGFKEGTALIKLKKENEERKNDELAAEAQKIIDQENAEAAGKIGTMETGDDEPGAEVVESSKGWKSSLKNILVFIIFVIIFYVVFIYILN